MRFHFVPIFAALLFLTGCATENVKQEAFNRNLVDGFVTMYTLHSLDDGKTNNAVRNETQRLAMEVDGLAFSDPPAHLAPDVKQSEIALARQVLDYYNKHRADMDPRSPEVQAAMEGLKKILTEPDDVKRLKKLLDYQGEMIQMRSVAP